jgi:hypothetical protein
MVKKDTKNGAVPAVFLRLYEAISFTLGSVQVPFSEFHFQP